MNDALCSLWAKTTSEPDNGKFHPLILHMLDVAACTQEILRREPPGTIRIISRKLGIKPRQVKDLACLISACHDIGKASPGFQMKWPGFSSAVSGQHFHLPRIPNCEINHAYASQLALKAWLRRQSVTEPIASVLSMAAGCHHGTRPSSHELNLLDEDISAIGDGSWTLTRAEIIDEIGLLFPLPEFNIDDKDIDGTIYMLLAGLTTVADWIASDEGLFCYGEPDDCLHPSRWLEKRRMVAKQALDRIGWLKRKPLASKDVLFQEAFPKMMPRPLQVEMERITSAVAKPSVYIIEAPMGEGKTEAALLCFLRLQAQLSHRGFYIAMPTQATGNAMYQRVVTFLQNLGVDRKVDLQLVHGSAALDRLLDNKPGTAPASSEGLCRGVKSDVEASEWFGSRKKALLSEHGVGTIDQALMSVLNVRHNYLRMWGLANKVVVFDEVHAYDAYTGALLKELIIWLHHLGSSVVILSATLPESFKVDLLKSLSMNENIIERRNVDSTPYPRVTVINHEVVDSVSFNHDRALSREIRISNLPVNAEAAKGVVDANLPETGLAAVIMNTVDRAQHAYLAWGDGTPICHEDYVLGKCLSDGTEVYLFHARYPSDSRKHREKNALALFGSSCDKRSGRRIMIATQVIEQSLDLDFDLMVTDLAPIDLILQRVGRLWRKPRERRPINEPLCFISGLKERSIDFGKPLWWDAVYRNDILIKTWAVLNRLDRISLPGQIDELVQEVYAEEFSTSFLTDDFIAERLEAAENDCLAEQYAMRKVARHSTIGRPNDGTWENYIPLLQYDDERPGLHPSLLAKTREGERSITVIPIGTDQAHLLNHVDDQKQVEILLRNRMSVSRKDIVKKMEEAGIPEGWKGWPLIRYYYPLLMDEKNRWVKDGNIRLDKELGLVYEQEVYDG